MNTEAIRERLAIVIEMRTAMHLFGWTDTPALDAEIAELTAKIA